VYFSSELASSVFCYFLLFEWRETVVQLIATVLFVRCFRGGREFVFVDESESGEGQLRPR
jgi:hypothetical protein